MFPYDLLLTEAERRQNQQQLTMVGHDDLLNYKARIIKKNDEATKAVQAALRRDAEQMKARYDRKATNQDFTVGESVMLKRFTTKPGESIKHADHWTGRYRIIEVHPGVPKATIQSATDPKAKPRIVHFDQIKSEPYPIGEIQPHRENTDQDIIIPSRKEIAEEPMEIENDPKVMSKHSNSSGPMDQLERRPMSKRQMKRMRRRQNMKQRNAINQMKNQLFETSNELPPRQPYVTQFGRTIRRPKRYDNCYAFQNQDLPPVWHQQPNQRK